ncbi:MAG: hypothetical protein JXB88_04550 [Spirochaetales bacterium]|nr:hypothetical protein [Spirochaetales bacterium]
MIDLFKLILTPLTGFGHLFEADNIFGHIAWAVRYLDGEDTLKTMLSAFREFPPFLLSNCFPQGLFSKPVLPPYEWPYDITGEKEAMLAERAKVKEIKNKAWVTKAFYTTYQQELCSRLHIEDIYFADTTMQEQQMTGNAIDRTSLKAAEGMLFTDTFLWSENPLVSYVMVNDEHYSREWFEKIADYLSVTGMGKNKSTGKGKFRITIEEPDDEEKALFSYKSAHFISLSNCAGANLTPLSYILFTKYGRLGEEYSQAGIDGKLLFLKKPVVFYKAGSLFCADAKLSTLGQMIAGVHTDPAIVQYGYAFPLYIHYKEE